MSRKKAKQTMVPGKAVKLSDGREVGLYILGRDSFGWRFVNKKGDVTQIVLSREAMNAVILLHQEATWAPWQIEVTSSLDSTPPPQG